MQFGTKTDGLPYTDRPGAYAVIFNEQQQVAVMKIPNGYFLPGGGTDGEDPAIALAREILEEAGLGVRIISEIGKASQFCLSPSYPDGYNKHGTFYLATFTDKIGEAVEKDHELVWLSLDEAQQLLSHEFQRWAITKALEASAA